MSGLRGPFFVREVEENLFMLLPLWPDVYLTLEKH